MNTEVQRSKEMDMGMKEIVRLFENGTSQPD
jgi:hypothetical protein